MAKILEAKPLGQTAYNLHQSTGHNLDSINNVLRDPRARLGGRFAMVGKQGRAYVWCLADRLEATKVARQARKQELDAARPPKPAGLERDELEALIERIARDVAKEVLLESRKDRTAGSPTGGAKPGTQAWVDEILDEYSFDSETIALARTLLEAARDAEEFGGLRAGDLGEAMGSGMDGWKAAALARAAGATAHKVKVPGHENWRPMEIWRI